jgi:Fe-S cluster biogenesis protein NfuA
VSDRLPFDESLERIAELAEELTAHPDAGERVGELLDWVDAFHREGLGRLVEMVRAWRGDLFLEQAEAEPVVGLLLAAYGLGVDVDVDTHRRVQRALDEVRPYIHSHGGDVEVTAVADGVVRLRMHGSCDGCTASTATISERIEVAMTEHWDDFRRIELEPTEAEPHPPPPTGGTVTGLSIGRKST